MVGASAAPESAQGGAISGDCVVSDWPEETQDRIDLSTSVPQEEGTIPDSGDVVVYVHGLFGQDVLDSININGANQASALDVALTEQGIDAPVVAGMWDSTTTWTVARWRADDAGKTLARWVEDNDDRYDSITILGHSLGSRVTLSALDALADSQASVTSAGLLGAGVDPDTVCNEYASGIENAVDEAVYNYYSTGDRIVCYAYAALQWTSGLGCSGAECASGGWWFSSDDELPDNFVDVDLSAVVDGHCNFFKPESMDYSGESGVPHVVEHQFADDGTSGSDGTDGGDETDDGEDDESVDDESGGGDSSTDSCWLFCW